MNMPETELQNNLVRWENWAVKKICTRSKQEMEETHLGKIEQDAEKRIEVLTKERDKYNVDKKEKETRNQEIQTALVNKTCI